MVFSVFRTATISAFVGYTVATYLKPEWSIFSLALAFLGWAAWTVILYPKFFSPLRGLPEPKNLSWQQVGEYQILPSHTPMIEWVNTVPNTGLIRYLGLFNQERLVVATPNALAEVLVTKPYDFGKPPLLRIGLGRILGIGLLLAESEEHKHQRRHLLPAFAFRHIKDLYPMFWDKARESAQAIIDQSLIDAAQDTEKLEVQPEDSGRTAFIEICSWASRTTIDIIGLAGLGQEFGAITNPSNEIFQAYSLVFTPTRQARFLNLLKVFLPGWFVHALPLQRNRDVEAARHTLRSTCYKLIREKKEKLAHKQLTDVDILSVALESGFSDEELANQMMTFLVGGHETTATSLIWAIYTLCRYPKIQARLRQEITGRLPVNDPTATISSHDVDHLPYLNAVCSEVLRCFPPIPISVREATVDTTIQNVKVPKGTRIVLPIMANNKDMASWGPDSMDFNPDRWLPRYEGDASKGAARGHATSNYAFMSFLHGPRSCIGMSFAKAEFACLLAVWVGKFEFELRYPEEMDWANVKIKKGNAALRPIDMHVKVKVLG